MGVLHELIDLVFPVHCLCCDRPGALWCLGCQPAAGPRLVTPRRQDGRAAPGVPPVHASGEYAGELRTVLLAFKERGRRQLAGRLADYLGDAVDAAVRAAGPGASPVLVPVPSARRAARTRGGDHVLRLARLVERRHAVPVLPAVRLAGPVRDSAGLSVGERRRNLAGRMVAGPPPPGLHPVLVDDIVTSGTTLAEAARALVAAGWTGPGAAVVAATRLRRDPAANRAYDDPAAGIQPAARGPPAGSRSRCRVRQVQLGRTSPRR
ncbi:MAG TPA: ComF family protein [Jatrophihabitans sp.]|nr:ComF family protein [Jatrophihabitans sp.]